MERKRSRDEEESCNSPSLPEAKRFHADILLGIFDDGDEEDDEGGREAPFDVPEELATVMRSLEREIALPAPSPSPPPELGYLLEASDDELGIPPPAEEERGGGVEAERAAAMWLGDDDGISGYGYDVLGFGFVRFEEEYEVDDGGPFDYAGDDIWIV
ncbi:hypothetical protein MUK42_35258 [Musa troglodytarum]|uniref:Uncharacterized protein n=1 Tax=Musa troglodytarum TaxID=320322 RepID=A0A9E7EHS1_9LILI|nr:hypothetical protein MUK42_35258 [Musa troglodytarum]